MEPIHILTGPTAVGKTEIALQWAKANNAEIVSCDSLLFYRGMDIGTAKPSREQQQEVRHHLIDIAEVDEQVNITQYTQMALGVVGDIQRRQKQVLVVGGSGFYLKAFFAPVHDEFPIKPEIRTTVRDIEAHEGLEGMVAQLEKLNPQGVGSLDVKNPRRVARALERCLTSGETLVELEERFRQQVCPFAPWQKHVRLLHRDSAAIEERISERTGKMLEAGLVEEVKGLIERGLLSNPSAANAIGYREVIAHLQEEQALETLADVISLHTRQLVAKQRKWFRHQLVVDEIVEL